MNKIFLPVDFSDHSKNCLVYAISLAHNFSAELFVLHAYGRPKVMEDTLEIDTESQVEAINKLKNFVDLTLDKSTQDYSKAKISYVAKIGLAGDVILNTSEEENADLIVMGTHGTSNILNLYFGGVSITVMSKAKCPVLIIPPSSKFKGWNHFGCTINFNFDDLVVFNTLLKWSKVLAVDLTCLHVITEDNEDDVSNKLNLLEDLFPYDNVKFKTKSGDIKHTVELFESEENLDLLGMIHHDKNLMEYLLNSDTTKSIAEGLKIPLLVFNMK